MKTIGMEIREQRKAKKLTQKALSKKAGLSNTYISDIETGRTLPSIKSLAKLCKGLEIDGGNITLRAIEEINKRAT
ncbi:MAG: helix-turn-helix domain-containing protein [Clostridium sp.]